MQCMIGVSFGVVLNSLGPIMEPVILLLDKRYDY